LRSGDPGPHPYSLAASAIAQTAGGQHSNSISFDTEPNELPLIREGCAMRALTFVDQEIFAPGMQARAGKHVA
jgi:hypothetical protein